MFTDPFDSLSTFGKAATIAFYMTIAVIVIGVVLYLVIKKIRPETTESTQKTLLGLFLGYSIGLIGILLFLKLDEYLAAGYVDLNTFIPVVILLGIIFLSSIVGLIMAVFKPDKFRLFARIALAVIGAALLALIIMRAVEHYKQVQDVDVSKEVMLYVFTALISAAIVVLALVFGQKREDNHTKSIVYAAICIAMSFALSYIRFLQLPQGGCITLASLLPLMIYSYLFGIRKGVLAGVVAGFLLFIQEPWFYHPIQFLLDYPIAFGAIGLSGLFHEKKIFEDKKVVQFLLGGLLSVIIRYFSHVVSGVFVFGTGDENYTDVAWSFLYNSFAFADMAICMVVGCGVFASRSFTSFLERSAS